jgi:hypothetical protein
MFIYHIYHKDTKVIICIDSMLSDPNLYNFTFNCGDNHYAQLLCRHLCNLHEKYKKEIAFQALHYLCPEQISDLKKELKNWNSKDHCWKWITHDRS